MVGGEETRSRERKKNSTPLLYFFGACRALLSLWLTTSPRLALIDGRGCWLPSGLRAGRKNEMNGRTRRIQIPINFTFPVLSFLSLLSHRGSAREFNFNEKRTSPSLTFILLNSLFSCCFAFSRELQREIYCYDDREIFSHLFFLWFFFFLSFVFILRFASFAFSLALTSDLSKQDHPSHSGIQSSKFLFSMLGRDRSEN